MEECFVSDMKDDMGCAIFVKSVELIFSGLTCLSTCYIDTAVVYHYLSNLDRYFATASALSGFFLCKLPRLFGISGISSSMPYCPRLTLTSSLRSTSFFIRTSLNVVVVATYSFLAIQSCLRF